MAVMDEQERDMRGHRRRGLHRRDEALVELDSAGDARERSSASRDLRTPGDARAWCNDAERAAADGDPHMMLARERANLRVVACDDRALQRQRRRQLSDVRAQ